MRKFTLSMILLFLIGSVTGQSFKTDDNFKSSGKPFVKIFTNFHSNFTNGKTYSLFEVKRVYFGYVHAFNKYFSGKVNLDVENLVLGHQQTKIYLKNALVQYDRNGFKVQFGLIGTTAFKLMERCWGNRYLFKSFQDQNGFNPSADFGIVVTYRFFPFLSTDFSIYNGGGYKHPRPDSTFKYAFGITLTPVKRLFFRAYYDVMNYKTTAQQTFSFFVNYNGGGLNVGAEYDRQINHDMVPGKNYRGCSFFAGYQIKKVKIIARYDYLSSTIMTGQATSWNDKKDGQTVIAGLEIHPVKGVKVTPNLQVWIPNNVTLQTLAGAYLSMEIKF